MEGQKARSVWGRASDKECWDEGADQWQEAGQVVP